MSTSLYTQNNQMLDKGKEGIPVFSSTYILLLLLGQNLLNWKITKNRYIGHYIYLKEGISHAFDL